MVDSLENLNLLAVKEVARRLQCSQEHIYSLIRKGDLPAYRLSERRVLVSEEDLLGWLETKRKHQS